MYKLLVISIIFLLGFYFIYKSNDVETFTNSADSFTTKISEKCPDVLIQKGAAFFLYNSKRANVPGVNPIKFDSLDEYVEFTEWQRSQGILCPILYLQHAYDAQGEPVYKARPSPTNLQGGQPDYIVTPADLPGMQELSINSSGIQAKMIPPPLPVPIQGIYGRDLVRPGGKPLPGGVIEMPDFQGNTQASAVPLTGAQLAMQSGNMQSGNMQSGNMQSGNMQSGNMQSGNMQSVNNYPGFDPQNQLNTPLDNMFNQTKGVSPNPMDHNWGGAEYTENLVKAGYYKDNEVKIRG
jgi:hypothetical protein